MVTRNIKANKPTQVNSDKIGVLVHPNTYPPIVTVDDIVVDYNYEKVTAENGVPNPEFPDIFSGAITDTNNNVYYWKGGLTTIGGVDYYIYGTFPGGENIVYGTNNPAQVGDSIYSIDTTDPENPVITTIGTIGTLFLQKDHMVTTFDFIKNSASDYLNTNWSYTTFQVGGDFLLDVQNGYKVGYVISGPSVVTDNDVTFVKGSVQSDYQSWTNDDYVASGFGTRSLYTTTDSPAVGDTALFTVNPGEEDYNVQTIKDIDTTETPVDPDPVNCTVSYSVDGTTWTEHPTVLTDENNVICNIPKYVYLKFSQDVVITVE